eukprot:gene312-316_t
MLGCIVLPHPVPACQAKRLSMWGVNAYQGTLASGYKLCGHLHTTGVPRYTALANVELTMKALQRRHYSFDTRSVMLFAALSLGGVGALQAQTGGVSTAAAAAFDKADTNKDGQLSAQEAATLPAISQRFKELDTDKNGSLSRAEFDKGVQS